MTHVNKSYLHRFKTQGEFDQYYNSEQYEEPFVSVTEFTNGNVKSVYVYMDAPEESGYQDISETFHYFNSWEDSYFTMFNETTTIEDAGETEDPNNPGETIKYLVICGCTLYANPSELYDEYDDSFVGYYWYFDPDIDEENPDSWYTAEVITESDSPQAGDQCRVFTFFRNLDAKNNPGKTFFPYGIWGSKEIIQEGEPIFVRNRNPKPGDIFNAYAVVYMNGEYIEGDFNDIALTSVEYEPGERIDRINYNKINYEGEYLTFEFLSSGSWNWRTTQLGGVISCEIEWSRDKVSWNLLDSLNPSPTGLIVSAGDKVFIRGNNDYYAYQSGVPPKLRYAQAAFEFDATVKISGNIMSLIYGDNFNGQTVLPTVESPAGAITFGNIFSAGETLIDVSNLILPATTLTENCYRSMFQSCLTIEQAPVLPAETLETGCYSYMFNNCTNLSYVKCLATDISAANCTASWLNNVSESGTFVKASGMEDWTEGIDGIPEGWTVKNA